MQEDENNVQLFIMQEKMNEYYEFDLKKLMKFLIRN